MHHVEDRVMFLYVELLQKRVRSSLIEAADSRFFMVMHSLPFSLSRLPKSSLQCNSHRGLISTCHRSLIANSQSRDSPLTLSNSSYALIFVERGLREILVRIMCIYVYIYTIYLISAVTHRRKIYGDEYTYIYETRSNRYTYTSRTPRDIIYARDL